MNQFVKQFLIAMGLSSSMYFGIMYFAPKTSSITEPAKTETSKPKATSNINAHNRVSIHNDFFNLSMNRIGAKIDIVQFKKYANKDKKPLIFLQPEHSKNEFFTCIKFIGDELPQLNTEWNNSGSSLLWNNDTWNITQAFEFKGYKIINTVTVKNISKKPQDLTITSYTRRTIPENKDQYTLFITNRTGIQQIALNKMKTVIKDKYTGWIGTNDLYWLFAVLSYQDTATTAMYSENKIETMVNKPTITLQPNEIKTETFEIFIGPKEEQMLELAQETIGGLDLTINYGWLPFLTKPIAKLLNGLTYYTGSAAIGLILFILLAKIAFIPLTIRSQRSMVAMKTLQPHIQALKEQYKDSPKVLQLRMLELYKEHKINPLSGCLPIILQLLMFLPIYNVLSNSIEFYQQPFFGWITDLSAPDPSSWTNLFGLLPIQSFDSFFNFGLWPLLMGASFLSQSYDSSNKQMSIMFLVVSIFMTAKIPVCITIYWTLTNLLNFLQTKISFTFFSNFFSKRKYGYV